MKYKRPPQGGREAAFTTDLRVTRVMLRVIGSHGKQTGVKICLQRTMGGHSVKVSSHDIYTFTYL